MTSPARKIAYAVLQRVEQGAYASDLLLARSASLDRRDAALTHEIVFGCLRRQAQLDFLIERWSGRPSGRLDPEVRTALRMGIYQLRHLDRIPLHSAVNESVELVKEARKRSATGFVNAVLRKVTRDSIEWPSRAVALSQPEWLLRQWDRQFGTEVTDAIGEAFLHEPEIYVRNPPPDSGAALEPTEVPGAVRVIRGSAAGLRIQDIGSQSIVPLLDLQPGETFLDLCAAPGNKTAQALESGVRAVACDLHLHRLRNVGGCARVVLDASQPLPFASRFAKILIDAPCSGTGTLGRNPEIRWRLSPSGIAALHETQVSILMNGLQSLSPGGRLIYSTCSLEREENEEVVSEVRRRFRVRVLNELRRTPGIEAGDGFYAAVLTSE